MLCGLWYLYLTPPLYSRNERCCLPPYRGRSSFFKYISVLRYETCLKRIQIRYNSILPTVFSPRLSGEYFQKCTTHKANGNPGFGDFGRSCSIFHRSSIENINVPRTIDHCCCVGQPVQFQLWNWTNTIKKKRRHIGSAAQIIEILAAHPSQVRTRARRHRK